MPHQIHDFVEHTPRNTSVFFSPIKSRSTPPLGLLSCADTTTMRRLDTLSPSPLASRTVCGRIRRSRCGATGPLISSYPRKERLSESPLGKVEKTRKPFGTRDRPRGALPRPIERRTRRGSPVAVQDSSVTRVEACDVTVIESDPAPSLQRVAAHAGTLDRSSRGRLLSSHLGHGFSRGCGHSARAAAAEGQRDMRGLQHEEPPVGFGLLRDLHVS